MVSIFDKLYVNRFNETQRKVRKAIWEVLCRDFFQRFISQDDTVVDAGAGFCEFINFINADRKIAIDELTITQFAQKNVEILDSIDKLKSGSIDVIFMSNFLEHLLSIEDAISKLIKAREALKHRGRLIIMGPNIRYIHDRYWIFIDHRIPLTDVSLAELLRALDFKINRVIPKFLPFTTKSRYPQWRWLVRIYLRAPVLWKIFGRQYLILCEKP